MVMQQRTGKLCCGYLLTLNSKLGYHMSIIITCLCSLWSADSDGVGGPGPAAASEWADETPLCSVPAINNGTSTWRHE